MKKLLLISIMFIGLNTSAQIIYQPTFFGGSYLMDGQYVGETQFKSMLLKNPMAYNMWNEGIINRRKPHHLLGCGLPQEFAFYRHWVWIDSIDTSNPVMAGIKDMEYDRQPQYDIWGLDDKPAQKLYTIINDDVDEITFEKIKFNIEKFDYNINGWG